MNFLTQKNRKDLAEFGYVLVESGLENTATLLEAQKSYHKVFSQAESGQYPYFRVYNDYLGKKNISGIEMPFHPEIINKNIVNCLNTSNLVKGTKEILGNKLNLALSRYHMTKAESGHVGGWHRDGGIGDDKNIQVTIFLFDEKGLEVMPGTHVKEDLKNEEKIAKYQFTNLKKSIHLKGKAGNVLYFNPAILHRGICSSFRANIHFRFSVDAYYESREFDNLSGFNQDWVDVLSNRNSVIVDPNLEKYVQRKGFLYIIKKSVRTFVHYAFFLFPNNFILFKRLGVQPNLRLRKIFYKNM